MARLVRFALPILIIAVGYLGYRVLSTQEPDQPPPRFKRETPQAETTLLKRTDYRVILSSQGIVRPHNETALTPRVSGRIIRISPQFESGSFFAKGQILLELDPADFQAEIISSEARLAQAEASLAQEKARAEQALLDWRDLGYESEPTELVLRRPQLKEAEANLKAAQATLEDSHLALQRTKVTAPYPGRVRERLVGLGQSVTPGTILGHIYSTDFAEIRFPLSPRELAHIDLPQDASDPPIPIVIEDAFVENSTTSWDGHIVRTEGTLDEKSRKLFVIARIDDPFGMSPDTKKNRALMIGQPVRGIVAANLIPNVFVIPRQSLHQPGQVLLVNPETSRLLRQPITQVWSDPENLVVAEDLTEGWHLVTSALARTGNGVKVEIVEPPSKTQ